MYNFHFPCGLNNLVTFIFPLFTQNSFLGFRKYKMSARLNELITFELGLFKLINYRLKSVFFFSYVLRKIAFLLKLLIQKCIMFSQCLGITWHQGKLLVGKHLKIQNNSKSTMLVIRIVCFLFKMNSLKFWAKVNFIKNGTYQNKHFHWYGVFSEKNFISDHGIFHRGYLFKPSYVIFSIII